VTRTGNCIVISHFSIDHVDSGENFSNSGLYLAENRMRDTVFLSFEMEYWIPEMSTDRTGSDCIKTEASFGWIRTGSDCNFFETWRSKTGSDRENDCCFNVNILKKKKKF